MQLYMSWYIRSLFSFTFLNILYFFKYFCTNIFRRRSLYTFYSNRVFATYPIMIITVTEMFMPMPIPLYIFVTHLIIIIIILRLLIFPTVVILFINVFLRLFFCHLFHLNPEKDVFPLLLWNLCVQMIGHIMAWKLYLFVRTLHFLIIIIMQTYLKTLKILDTCQVYSAKCVSQSKLIFTIISFALYGAMCFQLTHACSDVYSVHCYCLMVLSYFIFSTHTLTCLNPLSRWR